jgi:hypothetical protein
VILGLILASLVSAADPERSVNLSLSVDTFCKTELSQFKKLPDLQVDLSKICTQAKILEGCQSVNGDPIFHIDFPSHNEKKKKILVFSLIHGDELPAGEVGRYWLERLSSLENARNEWRVIPILNPDGLKMKSRLNARGVDLNRNFPTRDWGEQAHALWKKLNQNPRRYPGDSSNSEPETQCALKHIEEYKPDLITSVHTPLGVLDFDGPKVNKKLPYNYLPWKSLGHFPGSLGRYMWFERKVPVLTAEFFSQPPQTSEPLSQLQDVIGSLVQWL